MVQEYERAVIFRLGRLQSGGSRGIFFVLPCIESYSKVDLRTSCFDVPPQEVRKNFCLSRAFYRSFCSACWCIQNEFVKRSNFLTHLQTKTSPQRPISFPYPSPTLSSRQALLINILSTEKAGLFLFSRSRC